MFSSHPIPLRDLSEIKAGDIIGFAGDAWGSVGINLATFGIPYWSLSHVGIMGEYNGRLLLFESNGNNPHPCSITGQRLSGSQAHEFDSRIAEYRGRIWHYPLTTELFSEQRTRLTDFLVSTLGRPYDTIGAMRAGGIGFSWIESLLREEDLHSLFCSELCAAAHARIGVFATANGSRWSPAKLVRRERWHGKLRRGRRIK